MKKTLRALLAVAAIGLLAAPAVSANDLDGEGYVLGKHSASQTLRIGDHVYQVTPNSRFVGKNGERLRFADLEIVELESIHMANHISTTYAHYQARRSDGGMELLRLELADEPPR